MAKLLCMGLILRFFLPAFPRLVRDVADNRLTAFVYRHVLHGHFLLAS